MKAIVCTKYGPPDVLIIKEISKPTPGDNEILIHIAAFPITTPDRRIRGLSVPFPKAQFILRLLLRAKFGFVKPRNSVLGNYLAGTVEAVGNDVVNFHVGDEVFAYTGDRRGTYAEYICIPDDFVIAPKPSNLTFEETAAIPYGGCNALYFFKRAGGIKEGQNMLIYGASGAIGSSAVQLAKHYGAKVTGVCSSNNMELVKSLGADCVIDYTKEDFTNSGIRYDIVFDAVGKIHASVCEKCLTESGRYFTVFSGNSQILIEDFILLKALAEKGSYRPVIDRCYPLEQIVDAHSYADIEHTKGIVVVNLQNRVGAYADS
jgi:NADPH:quinone reductase-like Zn-dependent oxidoreductase